MCNRNDICGFAAVKKKKLIKIFIHVQWVHQQILTKKFSFWTNFDLHLKVPVVIHVFHRLPWSEFTSVQSLMVMCQIESVVGNFLTLKFYLIFTPQCIGIVITNKQVVIFKTSFSNFEKKDKIGWSKYFPSFDICFLPWTLAYCVSHVY